MLAPLVISGNPVNVKRDFDPIALLFTFPFLLVVNPELGVKTLKDFVDYAKARPGVLNWGSPGIGTGGHLVTEVLLKQTGIKGQHVPYAGTTQQLLATAAGTLQFTFDTPGNSKGIRDAGKVIALAVTGDKRSNTAPEVPTFKELGYDGFDDLRVSNGLLAPKGTSQKVMKAFAAEMVKMNQSGRIHDTLVAASYEPGVMSGGAVRRNDRPRAQAMGRDRQRDRRADKDLNHAPIPKTNFNPPFNITRASHLVFTVRDLAKSREFYTEVMGLIVSDEDAGTLWLRGVEERAHHSLTLKKTTGQPQCERVGFRVFMDEDLDKAKAHFDRTGVKAAFVEVPHQDRTLHFNDPAGTPVELVATMKTVPRMHTRIDTHRGAGALRMDHYQVLVPDVLATAKFYMDLGFRISDYLYVEAAQRVVGTFLHRKDNPWDIVLLTRSGPRFHHGGYVVEAFEDIVRACDVAGNLGFADRIEHGPGRHGHQHSYYLYVRDPDGHRTELLLPGIQIIDIDDEPMMCPVKPNANSNLWGLPAPKSWVEEATNFAGVAVKQTMDGSPMTAERYLAEKAREAVAE